MATHLLSGNDESILRSAVHELVDELVGAGDRAMMVDEFDGDEYELRLVVDAAQTPSFLTDKRVIVARDIGRFNASELAPLLAYLADPLDSSDLVLVVNGGAVPKKLADAVKAVGTVVNTSPPSRPKDRQEWISEHIASAGLRIKPDAAAQLGQWLGEDAGRLDGILATLTSTYGNEHVLTFAEVEPFLGEAGGVPPWEFTDAIDTGNTTKALALLGRMMHAGGRHPLQIMAIMHGHYSNLAKLDGAEARSEADAAAATGLKGYPAKKALQTYNRLGTGPVRRAIELLAQADLDLRGAKDLDPELVMEVLVARLSKLRR
jgi:DNA polymerase III subunit delta